MKGRFKCRGGGGAGEKLPAMANPRQMISQEALGSKSVRLEFESWLLALIASADCQPCL